MAYRPHFAYHTPEGYSDERAQYPFDYRNIGNAPGFELMVGTALYNLVLRLDADAPFLWRGISWEYPDYLANDAYLAGTIAMKLRDAYGNYLSNDFIPLLNYAQPYYIFQPWTGTSTGPLLDAPYAGGMGVAWADEMYCPPSSVLQIDLLSLNINTCALGIGRFMARGVKRRPNDDCSQEYR